MTIRSVSVLTLASCIALAQDPAAVRGVKWLLDNQNDDGGWGGGRGTPSSVEETALAVEVLYGRNGPAIPFPLRDVVMRVGVRGDLGQVRDAQDLVVARERPQAAPHWIRAPAADAHPVPAKPAGQ